MHIEYLSTETYNWSVKTINDRLRLKTTQEILKEYKCLNKEQLLALIAYKTKIISQLDKINKQDKTIMDLLRKTVSLLEENVSLLEENVSLLEEKLGKKTEFFDRNKKPAKIIQFK